MHPRRDRRFESLATLSRLRHETELVAGLASRTPCERCWEVREWFGASTQVFDPEHSFGALGSRIARAFGSATATADENREQSRCVDLSRDDALLAAAVYIGNSALMTNDRAADERLFQALIEQLHRAHSPSAVASATLWQLVKQVSGADPIRKAQCLHGLSLEGNGLTADSDISYIASRRRIRAIDTLTTTIGNMKRPGVLVATSASCALHFASLAAEVDSARPVQRCEPATPAWLQASYQLEASQTLRRTAKQLLASHAQHVLSSAGRTGGFGALAGKAGCVPQLFGGGVSLGSGLRSDSAPATSEDDEDADLQQLAPKGGLQGGSLLSNATLSGAPAPEQQSDEQQIADKPVKRAFSPGIRMLQEVCVRAQRVDDGAWGQSGQMGMSYWEISDELKLAHEQFAAGRLTSVEHVAAISYLHRSPEDLERENNSRTSLLHQFVVRTKNFQTTHKRTASSAADKSPTSHRRGSLQTESTTLPTIAPDVHDKILQHPFSDLEASEGDFETEFGGGALSEASAASEANPGNNNTLGAGRVPRPHRPATLKEAFARAAEKNASSNQNTSSSALATPTDPIDNSDANAR